MVIAVTQASAFDMLECARDTGGRERFTRSRFGEMARQVSEGASMTLREPGGRLIAVVGLWPEADHAEAWLAIGPAFRANLLAALREIRSSMDQVAVAAGVSEVRAYVRAAVGARVAGARMASWLGFEPAGTEQLPTGTVQIFTRRYGAETDGGKD